MTEETSKYVCKEAGILLKWVNSNSIFGDKLEIKGFCVLRNKFLVCRFPIPGSSQKQENLLHSCICHRGHI